MAGYVVAQVLPGLGVQSLITNPDALMLRIRLNVLSEPTK